MRERITRMLLVFGLAAGSFGLGTFVIPQQAAALHCENNGCQGLNCVWMSGLNCAKSPGGSCTSSSCPQ